MIKVLNKAISDCLLILDCWVPDRLEEKWKPEGPMTEIMYAGNSDKDGNFFETIHRSVQQYATSTTGKAKRTIPEIMANDYSTSSNTRRVWIHKTEKGSEDVVRRFAVIPDQVRRDHKLDLVAVEIQGPSYSDSEDSDSGDEDDGDGGENGGGDGSDGGSDDQDDGDDGDGEDSENGSRSYHCPDGGHGGDDNRQHMGDENTNDGQDDSSEKDDTDALREQLRKQLRTTPSEIFRDSPEVRKNLLALSKSLEPAPQRVERPPKRQRLFGRQLPSSNLGGGEVVGPIEGDDRE